MKTRKKDKSPKKGGRPTKYHPGLLLDIYDLARQGHSDQRIAKIVGIFPDTFKLWKMQYPEIKTALERGRALDTLQTVNTYEEYVFNKLPPELQDLWEDINRPRTEPNAISRLESALEDSGRLGHQQLFLYALVHANFDLAKACKLTNVSKKKLDHWVRHDPRFGELLQEMEWHKKNFFEGALIDLVARGETAAVLFANKTYNADRGYGNKKEITKNVNVSGTVNHNHTAVPINELDLPLETKKQLLAAIRAKKEEPVNVTPEA